MTPPAYTVPALPGLLAPQLRAFDSGHWIPVLVLREEGAVVRVWREPARAGAPQHVSFSRLCDLHLDLRDRLTAAHVAWWARPLSHAEFNPDDYDRVDRR
jgi:hypothetical protein